MIDNSVKQYILIFVCISGLLNSCSTEPIKEITPEKIEKVGSTKRAWNPAPQCCNLHSEFLGVVVLSKVCVSDTETQLELYTKESKKVCVLKEGMVFRDDLGTSYSFLKSEGVGLCPKRTQMKNIPFTLYFQSISSEAGSFDLIEDKNAKHAHKPWVFEKVDLTQCVWK
ncbi:hypothetical protein LEP1GSC195_0259 [Leptospira wolbachii serovar Codice str. CDC]|uniref:Lipoprotein n=1 Tax=Leptospira wolbachii serovar Codice str. CDC TaxID=1218599 RepID=R9A6D4_9LEPT|nr:hypothetical protein [Leptospira wolbachii]EOQ97594.1 hypothetical protein LEP1GSC195_0259 [Leptospira wolbachii serovar Codice str. CDC]